MSRVTLHDKVALLCQELLISPLIQSTAAVRVAAEELGCAEDAEYRDWALVQRVDHLIEVRRDCPPRIAQCVWSIGGGPMRQTQGWPWRRVLQDQSTEVDGEGAT